MAEKTEAEKAIEKLVAEPRSVQTDGGAVVNIGIADAIAADQYLEKKKAAAAKPAAMGIRIGKFSGPGQF
jgi:hypothetical protein